MNTVSRQFARAPGPCVPPSFAGVTSTRANLAHTVGLAPTVCLEVHPVQGHRRFGVGHDHSHEHGTPAGTPADAKVIVQGEPGPLIGLTVTGFAGGNVATEGDT